MFLATEVFHLKPNKMEVDDCQIAFTSSYSTVKLLHSPHRVLMVVDIDEVPSMVE